MSNPLLVNVVEAFGTAEFDKVASDAEWQFELQMSQAEEDCLAALESHSEEIEAMERALNSCESTLETLQESIQEFSTAIGRFLIEVAAIQQQADATAKSVADQKRLSLLLSAYIDKLVISPEMDSRIKTLTPANPLFVEAVAKLDQTLALAEETALENYPSAADTRRLLYSLKAVASEKCRDYILAKLLTYFSQPVSAVTVLQTAFASEAKSLYEFLCSANPLAGALIRGKYVSCLSQVHLAQAHLYFDDLLKIPIKSITLTGLKQTLLRSGVPNEVLKNQTSTSRDPPSTWFQTLIGARANAFEKESPQSPMQLTKKNEFPQRMMILSEWDKKVIQMQRGTTAMTAQYPEEIFRSGLNALCHSGAHEWQFIKNFFYGDVQPSPDILTLVRRSSVSSKTSEASQSIGEDSVSSRDEPHYPPLRSGDTPAKMFENVFLKTMLFVKERLEAAFTDDYDAVSLCLSWRLVDRVAEYHKNNQLSFATNLFISLQLKAVRQLSKVVALYLQVADTLSQNAVRRVRASHVAKNPFLPRYSTDSEWLVPRSFLALLLEALSQIVIVANQPSEPVSQNKAVTELVTSLATSIKMLVTTVERVAEEEEDLTNLNFRIQEYTMIQDIAAGLEQTSQLDDTCSCPEMKSMIDNLNEWAFSRATAVSEGISEKILNSSVVTGFPDFVRRVENILEEGNREDLSHPSLQIELRKFLQSQKEGWSLHFESILAELKREEILKSDAMASIGEDLLRRTLTKYVLLYTRFCKIVETVAQEGSDEGLKQTLLSLSASHQLMKAMRAISWT